ncbi:MAG: Chromate resistance protein ChrB [Acidimicrobiia bacterium]
MAGHLDWVLLAYRLPREPSTPRITVWRKLKRLGVAQLVDGLVALPLDARTKEQFEWLGDEIVEAGGEATIWTARLSSVRQERELAERMADAVAAEYRAVADAAAEVAGAPASTRRRTLARLRRALRRVGQRDYFPPPERETARAAVDAWADLVETDA